jgi:hypothetical protein
MVGGILGYAQFPGGNSSTDGVVIDSVLECQVLELITYIRKNNNTW